MNRGIAILLLILSTQAPAGQVAVEGARVWTEPDKTRLVVDIKGPVEHKIFSLDGPDRVVVDIADARFVGSLPKADPGDPTLVGLRSGVREGDDLRLVVDLKQPVRVKSFLLSPNDQYGHRLVIDLIPKGGGGSTPNVAPAPDANRPVGARSSVASGVVVAIDAGHGGEDPGAIGAGKTREKDVTLAIARKLAALVDKEPGMRPLLIRDGDYYIGLRKRILKARKHEADIFVSIHADAFTDRTVRGSSVYTLSHRGASSEAAKWLADRENSADLIGGVDLGDGDDLLATVLLDMTQNATIEHSTEAAKAVLTNLGQLGSIHKPHVQNAGFVVLKSPDIPSMLVETAFISNPDEERRLKSGKHQQQLAQAILAGIKAYFRKYPPRGALMAEASSGGRQHVIGSGDTLGGIATRYRVSLSSLRDANRLSGDVIQVGQVLTIPEGG